MTSHARAPIKRAPIHEFFINAVSVPPLILAVLPAGFIWHAAAANVENINAIRAKTVALVGLMLSERAMKTLPACDPIRPDVPAGRPPAQRTKINCMPLPLEQPAVPGPRGAFPPDDLRDGAPPPRSPRTET